MKDLAGNAMNVQLSWTFTTAVPLDQGPGGPIPATSSAANPYVTTRDPPKG